MRRPFLLAALCALMLALLPSALAPPRPAAAAPTIAEYPIPTANSGPNGMAVGSDGALWFVETTGNKIGRITVAGAVTEYPLPARSDYNYGLSSIRFLDDIVTGPDGALWFTEFNPLGKIWRITVAGALTEYAVPGAQSYPSGITVGPDSALWFTQNGNKIGRITVGGAVTQYPLTGGSGGNGGRNDIVTGPDGALWFPEFTGIGRLTTSGTFTDYPTPTPNSGPRSIAVGPDGALWFAAERNNTIGRLQPDQPSGPSSGFADVPTNYWAYAQITKFAQRGITTGCGTDDQGRAVFCPERGVTRAEMAVFLDRTLGFGTPPAPASQRFSDVPTNYWAYAFIDKFATLGITTGCGGSEFCPDRGVNRAEMAAFLIRALKKGQLTPATPTFADVPTSHPQFGYVEALVKLGVTTGCGTNDAGQRLYCPDRGVTRAEMAVFIIRAFP